MPLAPPTFRPHGHRSKQQRDQDHDAKRRAEKPWRRWYQMPIWKALRRQQLVKQPLCERHLERGEVVPANTVNHRHKHCGEWTRFIDPANLESTCAPCHNSEIQSEEHRRGG